MKTSQKFRRAYELVQEAQGEVLDMEGGKDFVSSNGVSPYEE